ncbi:MAG: 23S rRNA (guanosine(2251)-2'-O)-methyltransferase RlmB [Rhodoplanes sp.]
MIVMSKRKPPAAPRADGASGAGSTRSDRGAAWIYGQHAVLAAVANPRRRCRRLIATPATLATLAAAAEQATPARPPIEVLGRRDLEKLLPPGAVHQGMALLGEPLQEPDLNDFLDHLDDGVDARVVVLDQANDPRNVGAVIRSAAAFGAHAVVVQERHSPEATGALAKAASGALEFLPLIRVTNIARSLETMKQAGFWCLALDARASRTIADTRPASRLALVVGAEGTGLRRLVHASCDESVRIPISSAVESLNVSVAAAVVLYEFTQVKAAPPSARRDAGVRDSPCDEQ